MTSTTTAFTALPLHPTTAAELRERDDAGRRRTPFTDTEGGSPLRCCLRRSGPGERIVLVSYAPLRRWAEETGADPGAYDECGPVFLHADPCPGPDGEAGGYPLRLHGPRRMLRAYDASGRILGGTLLELPHAGQEELDAAVGDAFADPQVAVVHLRAVEFGCFLAELRPGQP
ncbi:DUF1203 domain-containing protein [Streptacidiphilus monticola]|uniref:DUF1203 domain-containing protein n=1 Tax=Streptacidiphilus monticola TaxID=2161674 RepID=A0ABW1G224_9ACTN